VLHWSITIACMSFTWSNTYGTILGDIPIDQFMATENRGVMVYLAPELEQCIAKYCTESNITRKDKDGNITPSLGTGIVTYLKSTIFGISPHDLLSKAPSKIPSTGLTTAEVLDLIQESITSQAPSEGLSKDDVVTLIEESVKNTIPSTVFNIPSEEAFNTLLTTAIDTSVAPLKSSIERLESELLELKKPQAHHQGGPVVTTTDSIAYRESKTIAQECHKAVDTTTPPQDLTTESPQNHTRTETPTPLNQIKKGKPKPEGEPSWVNQENRRFYLKLVDDSELLAKARSAIDLHPTDNKALAESLVIAGLHKQDGTAFDSASTSRIRGVVKNLSTL
jgi:hypothetical protein